MSGGSSAGMSGAPPAGWPAPPRVALATVPSLTAASQGNLLRAFAHDAEAIFKASEAQLLCVKGIGPATAAAIRNIDLAVFGARMAEWRSAGLRLLQAGDADYPSALQRLYPLPPMLFTRGEWLPPRQRVAVGVVGTRSPSRQAYHYAAEIGERLVELGALLVSGLAVGIDAAAHWAALRVPDSYQLVVLGSGVLRVYPRENQPLADALLLGGGALLSELAPDAAPARGQFVARNRLLAALCGALVVVETGVTGGAMHTARFAREFGRPVFVADLSATGNRQLLQDQHLPLPSDLTEVLIAAGNALDANPMAPNGSAATQLC